MVVGTTVECRDQPHQLSGSSPRSKWTFLRKKLRQCSVASTPSTPGTPALSYSNTHSVIWCPAVISFTSWRGGAADKLVVNTIDTVMIPWDTVNRLKDCQKETKLRWQPWYNQSTNSKWHKMMTISIHFECVAYTIYLDILTELLIDKPDTWYDLL